MSWLLYLLLQLEYFVSDILNNVFLPIPGNVCACVFLLTLVVSTPPYLARTLGSWMVCRLVPVMVREVLPLKHSHKHSKHEHRSPQSAVSPQQKTIATLQ